LTMGKVVKTAGAMLKSLLVVMWCVVDVKGYCLAHYTKEELDEMGIKF
jgi:hypothetical protein